jgi:phosphate transport system substrate-binding protein
VIFKKLTVASVVAAAVTAAVAYAQAGRDYIYIVGSSTVYPFATTVAEQFGKATKFKTPKVESTGTGGGFKLFCSGVGVQYPDIADASRRVKNTEIDTCAKNGVKDIAEVVIGYDGIVFASARQEKPLTLTREQIYKAIAKQVPKDGKLVPNPYKRWNEIDPSLPADEIVVYGPASNHGTRDALVELVMDPVCEKFPEIKAITDEALKKAACQAVREDGPYIEISENYTITMQKLLASPHAVGILTFSYLDQNGDKIQGATVDGQKPTLATIASGKYPVSRPLFFYVKKAHVGTIPGIKEYITEFTSEKAIGQEGYLADKGLIPMPDAKRKEERANALNLKNVDLSAAP